MLENACIVNYSVVLTCSPVLSSEASVCLIVFGLSEIFMFSSWECQNYKMCRPELSLRRVPSWLGGEHCCLTAVEGYSSNMT